MSSPSGVAPVHARAVSRGTRDDAERSLVSYLVLPRPKDIVKWWIFPTGFVLGAVSVGRVTIRELLQAVVVWVVLELLAYQARYQWNDIVGFDADQRNPERVARRRLPGPPSEARRRKLASGAVGALRVLAALVVGLGFPGLHIELTNLVLVGAVFAVAAVYEWLKQRGTGWAHEVPPPLRPAIVGLWLVIGGGYAIRGVAGLALTVHLAARPLLAIAATVAMWTYGIAFVTSRWVVEALTFAHAEGGTLAWHCRPELHREHLLSLTRWLPDYAASPGGLPIVRRWRPLRARTPLRAPWNTATIASGTSAGLAGLALAGDAQVARAVGLSLAFAFATILVLRAPARARFAVLFGAGVVISGLDLISGGHRCLCVLAPWLLVVGAQVWFFSQSLDTIGRSVRGFVEGARRA